MRGYFRFVGVLCGVTLCASVVIGAPAEGKSRQRAKAAEKSGKSETKSALAGQLADLAKAVGMDDAQTQKMAKALKAKAEATKAWKSDPAKGGKLAELSKQLLAPEVQGNQEKTKELRGQLRSLKAELRALEVQHDAAIQGVLTPQQKQKWDVAVFTSQVTARLRKVQLTEEQQSKVKALCVEAQKKIVALGDKDGRGKTSILKEVRASVDALLTPQQKAQLKTTPAAKPADKKEKEKEKEKDTSTEAK